MRILIEKFHKLLSKVREHNKVTRAYWIGRRDFHNGVIFRVFDSNEEYISWRQGYEDQDYHENH